MENIFFSLLPLIIQIIYLLSRVLQSNSCKRPAESCPGRAAECDVIHEGLLDLQQNTSTSTEWVKYELWVLLKLLIDAFRFECADNGLIIYLAFLSVKVDAQSAWAVSAVSGTQKTKVVIWSLLGALAAQFCNPDGAQNDFDAGTLFFSWLFCPFSVIL